MPAYSDADALDQFYANLRRDIWDRLDASEEGGTQEQTFTQYVIDALAEVGEVENARECRDEKMDKSGRKQHKINGYSLSENLETVQLFFTSFKGSDTLQRTNKADIDAAVSQSTRFLKNALNGYFDEMEPTAPAYDFARELNKNDSNIQRAEIFILTDGECDVEKPEDAKLRNLDILYRIIDVTYLMRLDSGVVETIEIDFEQLCGKCIPCLPVPVTNDDYQSFLAVVPGDLLADIYKRYGARLLEMNVRAFLQFTGKINQGIRETIKKEPHMFLAFNNGIAATAEEVELIDLPQGGKAIKSIRGLQIVNGGQTTASILHTRQQDKAEVEKVFVQMKLSVIRNKDELSTIVNRISEFANKQNKVSTADLTANSPFHIEIEKLSRVIWAQLPGGTGRQSRWFYERARGQYKNELAKQVTKRQKEIFEAQTPKRQMFVKEELAKFVNLWAMQPHFIVRGSQKNYVEFAKTLTKKTTKPNNIFFEDLIAKAVLFRKAEQTYGVKPNAIGDLRYVTVPYTISYLNQVTKGRLNLYKIWKQQSISNELSLVLRELMSQVESAIKKKAPGSLYGEWAKKEECWQYISKQSFSLDLASIAADMATTETLNKRQVMTESGVLESVDKEISLWLSGIPIPIWNAIDHWGLKTEKLSIHKRTTAQNIATKIRLARPFTESELRNGAELIEFIMEVAPELFDEPVQESMAENNFAVDKLNTTDRAFS